MRGVVARAWPTCAAGPWAGGRPRRSPGAARATRSWWSRWPGTTTTLLGGPLPGPVRAVVADGLRSLPDRTTDLLAGASLLDRTFDAGLLADAAGLAPVEVFEALGPAVASGVLREETRYRYSFEVGVVREALSEALTPSPAPAGRPTWPWPPPGDASWPTTYRCCSLLPRPGQVPSLHGTPHPARRPDMTARPRACILPEVRHPGRHCRLGTGWLGR